MLQEERYAKIVDIVNQKGFVSVKELANICDVTLDCIRKDLTILEKKNVLERVHGGAHSIRSNIHAYNVKDREDLHTEEKEIITKKALNYIHDKEFIYMDISTININIVRKLIEQKRKLSIATNMIAIMELLRNQKDITCLMIGGYFNAGQDGFTGTISSQQVKQYKFDKCFMGSVGVDCKRDQVMTYDIDDAVVKKVVLENSKEKYLLVEHEKFNQDGHVIYTSLTTFNAIISDDTTQIKQQINNTNIQVI